MDDRYALERLKYRYFRTLDLKQWDDFTDCFTPDATGDYAGLAFDSRAELVDYMRANLGSGLITMHTAHHPEIDVAGDEASGIWYLEDTVLAPELDFASRARRSTRTATSARRTGGGSDTRAIGARTR